MPNLEITNFDPGDGIRAVVESEQALLTTIEADTIKRITILGRITATGKYCYYDVGNDPEGSGIPVAISLSEVEADDAGDYVLSVLLQGKVEEEKLIIHGSEPGVGITPAIKDSLRTYGIIVQTAAECATLDNQ